MVNFWKIVDRVIDEADIVLMVVDARMVAKTRNEEIERKVHAAGKTLITVINKADLVDKDQLEQYKQKLHPCVFVSAQKFYGMTKLRHMILRFSDDVVTVGVVGYPNTGKSSVINALKGKSSAPVSSVSGYTKGRQNIRVDNRIRIIDTPGVLSEFDDVAKIEHTITASVTKIKNPDIAFYDLYEHYAKELLRYYKIKDLTLDAESALEEIAKKLNRFKSGGVPDVETAARIIIQEWQKGKIQTGV